MEVSIGLSSGLVAALQEVQYVRFFGPSASCRETLQGSDRDRLCIELRKFFTQEAHQIQDPVSFLHRFVSYLPLEKIGVAGTPQETLQKAREMLEEAKYYLEKTTDRSANTLRNGVGQVLDSLLAVIESIVTAFGIGDFFKPAESDLHADFKSNKIMMLLSLFSMITTMILPILGAATGGLIIGGTLLAIAALSVIWPWIKPMPRHLPANAENWTAPTLHGGVAQGRKESIDDIANILKMGRHAILVGPSRVGKSLTAKAFAQAVARGDYPEFQGKAVFRINTADIVGQQASFLGGGNTILNKISAAMGRHRNEIILVFDEIHMACRNQERIADQLKTFLDEHGEFPHVIGITTEEEYNQHVQENTAFSLRFDRVDIQNTSKEETLRILGDTLLESTSRPLVEDGALEHIYTKAIAEEGAPQPATALKILKQCINKTGRTQTSLKEKRVLQISNQIAAIRAQAAAGRSHSEGEGLGGLEAERMRLQGELRQEKSATEKLFQSKKLLDRVTQEMYVSVLKISKVVQETISSTTSKQLKMFSLLRILEDTLKDHIQKEGQRLGVCLSIQNALVEAV